MVITNNMRKLALNSPTCKMKCTLTMLRQAKKTRCATLRNEMKTGAFNQCGRWVSS